MGSRLGAAILASLFAVSLWGCACCDKEHPRGPEFMNPTPVVAVRQIGTLLTPNRQITTHQQHVFQFSRGGSGTDDFFGVLGPLPVAPDNPSYGPAVATFANSLPVFAIESGYAYLTGHRPHTRTPRGSFTGYGTTMIVQVLPDRDRVFLLDGVKIEIKLDRGLPGPPDDRLNTRWHYVDVVWTAETVRLESVKPIPAPGDPIRAFVDSAIKTAKEAGLAISIPPTSAPAPVEEVPMEHPPALF
ncbi:MAG TPA: hypothetical protein PK098_04780 [Phycisphaerales bacterium]|nr:hypothetical protein [Phycisphaerales bacterium]